MTDCLQKIFKSANPECNKDFVDGYPAEQNEFTIDPSDFGFGRGSSDDAGLAELVGLPAAESGDRELLFRLGSGILLENTDIELQYYEGFRLDCGCLLYECGTGGTGTGSVLQQIDSCSIDNFYDSNGVLDVNCDQIQVFPTMILEENIGTCSTTLDGSISNMICQLIAGRPPDDISIIPPSGNFFFVDDYRIIYSGSFIYDQTEQVMDITFITKDPRVPGEERSGFRQGRSVFIKGVVTTCRQILEIAGNQIIIQAEGCEQKIEYIKTNYTCGDDRPEDNFCFHLDCMITDSVEFQILCGPRWADPEDPLDDFMFWPDLEVDSGGLVIGFPIPPAHERFFWVDAWGVDPSELTDCLEFEGLPPW